MLEGWHDNIFPVRLLSWQKSPISLSVHESTLPGFIWQIMFPLPGDKTYFKLLTTFFFQRDELKCVVCKSSNSGRVSQPDQMARLWRGFPPESRPEALWEQTHFHCVCSWAAAYTSVGSRVSQWLPAPERERRACDRGTLGLVMWELWERRGGELGNMRPSRSRQMDKWGGVNPPGQSWAGTVRSQTGGHVCQRSISLRGKGFSFIGLDFFCIVTHSYKHLRLSQLFVSLNSFSV